MKYKLKLAAVGMLLLAPVGGAQTYYSIDVVSDELCIVDVFSGAVTYIGPLQADLTSVDLAWHQGALYAKNLGAPAGNKICQIVTDGQWVGFTLQGQFLNGGGYQGGEVAGLASDGNALYLTYTTSNPDTQYSGSFGTVNPIWAGTIDDLVHNGSTHDIDSMGFAGGFFWGADVIDQVEGYDIFYGTSTTGVSVNIGGGNYNTATNPGDLERLVGNDQWLVSISQNGQNLVRISRTNGARGTITPLTGLQPGGVMKGLALRPNPCGRGLLLVSISHP